MRQSSILSIGLLLLARFTLCEEPVAAEAEQTVVAAGAEEVPSSSIEVVADEAATEEPAASEEESSTVEVVSEEPTTEAESATEKEAETETAETAAPEETKEAEGEAIPEGDPNNAFSFGNLVGFLQKKVGALKDN
ncbi:unnamed protein product [Ambrosiozyma monospora]|uniref:Unnamed protein product n=1 Tax=Ambrosiozyma monospora TaxID=43982 RepID=A0ACB5T616_AMBMO|nr:unnamed protein product [Ambrosiozyma monospora]